MSKGGQEGTGTDLWGGLLWCGLGAAIVFEALRMDRFTQQGASLYTMPGFVPGMLGSLLVLLGLVLCLRHRRHQRRAPATNVASADANSLNGLFSKRTLVAAGLSLLYAGGLLGRIPFEVATFLFVASFTYLFYEAADAGSRLRTALLNGLLSTAVIVLVFRFIFLVQLPKALL
jgi:hypothetical protein